MIDFKFNLPQRFVLRQIDFILEDSSNTIYMNRLYCRKNFAKEEIEYTINWLCKKEKDQWIDLSDAEKNTLNQYMGDVIDAFQNTKYFCSHFTKEYKEKEAKSIKITFDSNSFRMIVSTPFSVKIVDKVYTGKIESSRTAFLWEEEKINFIEEEINDSFIIDELIIAHDNTLTPNQM